MPGLRAVGKLTAPLVITQRKERAMSSSQADDKAQNDRDKWEHEQQDNSAGVMGRAGR